MVFHNHYRSQCRRVRVAKRRIDLIAHLQIKSVRKIGIKKRFGKKILLHSDHDVQKMLEKVQGEFKEYQLVLYIYGFAYFLEVMLQENYEKAYLSAIAKRIDEICFIPLIRL